MALGDFGNGDFGKEKPRPTTYGSAFANPNAKYEKTKLGFSMWKYMLKMTISPKINDGQTNYDRYSNENNIYIHMNNTKALVLLNILKEFKEAHTKNANVSFNKGVSTSNGIVIVSNGSYFGEKVTNVPTITIAKANEKGIVDKAFSYEIKIGTDFALVNYNPKTGSYDTESEAYKYDELDLIINQIDQFIVGSACGIAASVCDCLSFKLDDMIANQQSLADKLGVTLVRAPFNNGSSNYSKNSYFNNGGNRGSSNYSSKSAPSNTSTLDELELD